MGPDEKDTGVIVIYEEPDGPLLGTVDGEIPEIDLEEERPGVYLEGEVIEEIRNRVEKMIVQEAEAIKSVWQELYGNICAASGVFAKWITAVAAQIEEKHELETALLHDVCKVNCYHTETRRRKNPETGYWEDYQTYAFRDPLPLGHGEKSLYLIQRHMDLEPEEALAIRWHMGAYDNAAKGDGRALSAAMAASPWVWRLQQADMCAAWVDEREAAEE